MKKSYLSFLQKFTFSHWLDVGKKGRTLCFAILCVLMAQLASAQTTLTWKGITSSDATLAENWEPQNTPWGTILYIDSAYKFTNLPYLHVDTTRAVYQITNTSMSKITVDVDEGYSLDHSGATNMFNIGNLYKVGKGTETIRKNLYLNNNTDSIFISDGMFEVRSALLMGNAATATVGGYIEINETGRLHLRANPSRFTYPSTTMSNIVIKDDGKLTVVGNFTTIGDSLVNRTKQIRSTADRDIVFSYSTLDNLTTFYSRDKMIFLAEPTGVQYYTVSSNEGKEIKIIENEGLASMQSLTWRYGTVSGGPYTKAFSPAQTGDTILPSFAESGVFYLVCIGYNGTKYDTTNEITCVVASDKIHIEPSEIQKIKVGQTAYPLTIKEETASTEREWVYTFTPGLNYQSFSPVQTDSVITASFDSAATYYVACKSKIDGVWETSSEVQLIFTSASTTSDIQWNGKYSSDASNMLNWTPIAMLFKNNIIIDTANYDNYAPIYSQAGNDSVYVMTLNRCANFTLNKPENDSLISRSATDISYGTFAITSGIFKISSFLHLKDSTSILDVSGGKFYSTTNALLLGNASSNSTTGGYVNVYGHGVVEVPGFDRFCSTDTTMSVVKVWEDGKIIIHNSIANYESLYIEEWKKKNQLISEKGWEMVVSEDRLTDDTIFTITAYDPTAIKISGKDPQYISVNELSDTLIASNTAIFDSLVWKYSTTATGDLLDFATINNNDTAVVSFTAPGTYYVYCVGNNDSIVNKKSNSIKIFVPGVDVTPSEKQYTLLGGSGAALTVTESIAPGSRIWQNSATAGGPYTSTNPPITSETYNAMFGVVGKNYVVCASTYSSKVILSNEVEVEVVDLSISPTTPQTLVLNEDGNKLTFTENPAADSREWKYSTTKGSGYTSFATAQTGDSYTPNFATAGTYYVVCSSTWGSFSFESNEVKVTVGENAINNIDANSFAMYPNPSKGSFIINDKDVTSAFKVDVFNAQGKLVLTRVVENGQEIVLDTPGMYIVRLTSDGQVKTSKLVIE